MRNGYSNSLFFPLLLLDRGDNSYEIGIKRSNFRIKLGINKRFINLLFYVI